MKSLFELFQQNQQDLRPHLKPGQFVRIDASYFSDADEFTPGADYVVLDVEEIGVLLLSDNAPVFVHPDGLAAFTRCADIPGSDADSRMEQALALLASFPPPSKQFTEYMDNITDTTDGLAAATRKRSDSK